MIIRTARPSTKFTILKNSVLTDDRMSFRARGILASILSRPDDWRTSSENLARESGGREGRDAIRTALQELEKYGYLIRQKEKDPVNGRFSTNYYVFDEPKKPVKKSVSKSVETDGNSADNVSGDGLPGVGSADVGIDGAFNNKQLQRNKLENKQTRRGVSKSDRLNYEINQLAKNWKAPK